MTTVELLTLPEVQERLRVSRTTLFRLIREGRVRTVHIGARTLVTSRELEAFIDSLSRRAA